MMARAPDKRIEQAKEMYLQGQKLVEIASQLNLPEGTVRRWKCTHKWENERSGNKNERSRKRKRGAQPGNKNSHGGPPGNVNFFWPRIARPFLFTAFRTKIRDAERNQRCRTLRFRR